MRRLRSLLSHDQGAIAVEFSLILPVLILLMSLIAYFGLYFGCASSVQQLTTEAARTSLGGLSQAERIDLAMSFVRRNVGAYPLLRPASLAATAATDPADPDVLEVTLTYEANNFGVPLAGLLLPASSSRIVRRSKIRRGGF